MLIVAPASGNKDSVEQKVFADTTVVTHFSALVRSTELCIDLYHVCINCDVIAVVVTAVAVFAIFRQHGSFARHHYRHIVFVVSSWGDPCVADGTLDPVTN